MNENNRPAFLVHLEAAAGVTDEAAVRGLRALLKSARRGWGLRCIAAERVQMTFEPGPPDNALNAVLGLDSQGSTSGEVES